MREREFTPEERHSLESNPNVFKVVNSNIIYTEEFKQQALHLYKEGMSADSIFTKSGIDTSIFPSGYAKSALRRWRNASKQPVSSVRKQKGRPKQTCNMSPEEKDARIAYLEAENDFLKKLRALERGE